MNLAQGMEQRLEKLAEGASASLFRGKLHPVAIATRLVRQLEFMASDTPAGPQIPNDLIVTLNPGDLDPAVDRDGLTHELILAVTETAAERGWRLVGPVRMHVRTDAPTPRGVVACSGTSAPGSIPPWSQLVATDGSAVLPITINRTLVGRALDCDIRVANQEVSRHHGVIYRKQGRSYIADLESANGTFVNDTPVRGADAAIATGDTVTLGDLPFTFRKLV